MRIVVASDLHYAPSPNADAGLRHAEQLILGLAPDLIVVSGDLTREGLVEQFLPVVEFLERLDMQQQRRVRAIPGNRDYPAGRPGLPRPSDSDLDYFLTAPDTPGVEGEAPGVGLDWTPFGEFFGSLDFFERRPDLTIVGLNSEPVIPDTALDQAIAFFCASSPAVPRLFCTHRSLLPVPRKKLKEGDLLPNSGDILARLLAAHVDVVLCAHLHRVHAWQLADMDHKLVLVNAPSLLDTSGGKENGVVALDLTPESVRVEFHALDGSRTRVLADTALATRTRHPGTAV